MRAHDLIRLSVGALRSHRLRTLLSVIGTAIGVASVMLLTSLGEGARRYTLGQFTQFGTNLLTVTPGKTETFGLPGVLGGTTHKLTLDDAEAIRRVRGVRIVVPATMGQAEIAAGERGRSVTIFGVTSDMPDVWRFDVRAGRFLPPGDPRRGAPVAVLGAKVKQELFGERPAVGSFVRAAGFRLRVIGVLARKGRMLGFDIDDCAYVPVATSMRMFDLDELLEVDVLFAHERLTDQVEAGIRRILTARHAGREDFTITTQTAMLETLGGIMRTLTLVLAGIASISLLVGALGVLTLMWIAVSERTAEIGLIRALGAGTGQVQAMFLVEAAALSSCGGLVGLGLGFAIAALARAVLPGLPVHTPPIFVAAAFAVSVVTGLIAGVAPARRAARLDPIDALRGE